MELKNLLAERSSKKMVNEAVNKVLQNSKFVPELLSFALSDIQPIAWHACWAIYHIVIKKPEIFQKYIVDFITYYPKIKSESQKREMLKIIKVLSIPDEYEVEVYELALEVFISRATTMGVRSTALHIIIRIVSKYPELKKETNMIIKECIPYISSVGLKNQIAKNFDL